MRNPFRYFNSSPEVIPLTVMTYVLCVPKTSSALFASLL